MRSRKRWGALQTLGQDQRKFSSWGRVAMPEISRFLGIVVAMFYNDHPPPHFHVRYADQRALVEVESLAVFKGQLSPKILAIVVEWATAHHGELWQNWNRARKREALEKIAPPE